MNKKLLVFALLLVFLIISSTVIFGLKEIGIPKSDLNCYQKKCEGEKELWDNINSKCVFTPQELSYYKENNKNKINDLKVFLDKKEITSQSCNIIIRYMESDLVPYYLMPYPEEKRTLLEFQCQEVGLTLGYENCDEKLADNYLLMIDINLLKSDLSLDNKNKIRDIYSACIEYEDSTPKGMQIFDFIAFCILILFFPFCIALFIILGYWMLHRKEEGSFGYVTEGIYGFLISVAHLAVSLVIAFFFSAELLFPIPDVFFLFVIIAITPILGLIMEFKLYKKTGKMRWKYALIFSIVLIISAIIILYQDIAHPKLV